MNKHLIILALETLHEQVRNDSVWSSQSDNKKRIKEIKEQIKIMKELDIKFSTLIKYKNKYDNNK